MQLKKHKNRQSDPCSSNKTKKIVESLEKIWGCLRSWCYNYDSGKQICKWKKKTILNFTTTKRDLKLLRWWEGTNNL